MCLSGSAWIELDSAEISSCWEVPLRSLSRTSDSEPIPSAGISTVSPTEIPDMSLTLALSRYREGSLMHWTSWPTGLLSCMSRILSRTSRSKGSVSYTHLRAHETDSYLVCRLLLEKKKTTTPSPRAPASPVLLRFFFFNDTATTEIYTLHIVGSVRCV